ncbi:MED7 protein-domain-containing protein [Gaertneriomyces semiglobifer]|nr:MED7 protein-domain-containing protein [Gaertneriomyces semiglobifer]
MSQAPAPPVADPTGSITAAYPLPPAYYKLYTDAAVAAFPPYQRNKSESDSAQDVFSRALRKYQRVHREEHYPESGIYLHPPRPIEGHYEIFGAAHTTDQLVKSLRESGETQLYSDKPLHFGDVLGNLVKALLANLVQLVDVLATRPEQHAFKIQQVRQLLVNIHHVINLYRQHQARDTVRLILEQQIARRRSMTARLRSHCADLRNQLQASRELAREERSKLNVDADIDRKDNPSPAHEEGPPRDGAVPATAAQSVLQSYLRKQERLRKLVQI